MHRIAPMTPLALAALALFAGLLAPQARAELLTYTETAIGKGILDGVAFKNATITISETADTSAILNPSTGYYVLLGTTTVSVGGVTDTFTDLIAVSNEQGASVGFQDIFEGDILRTVTTDTSSYDLSSAIGPISDTAGFNSGLSFATQGGSFEIDDISSDAIFTASTSPVSAVPEPSSLAMCGLAGLIGSAYAWRRRQRAATA